MVERDKDLARDLGSSFRENSEFLMQMLGNGERGLECAFSWSPHIILVGHDLPGISTRDFCRLIKNDPRTRHIPLVALSFKTPEADVIETLRAGADEHINLPCSSDQLLWRVRAVLRLFERVGEAPRETIQTGPLLLVIDERTAYLRGADMGLRRREFDLLEAFVRSPGKVLTRRHLLESLWGYDAAVGTRTVDIHVTRIRKKLGSLGRKWIVSVRSVGYKFRRGKLPFA